MSVWYALSQKIITSKVGANINSEVLTIDIRDIQCTLYIPGIGNIIAQTMFVMPLLKRL